MTSFRKLSINFITLLSYVTGIPQYDTGGSSFRPQPVIPQITADSSIPTMTPSTYQTWSPYQPQGQFIRPAFQSDTMDAASSSAIFTQSIPLYSTSRLDEQPIVTNRYIGQKRRCRGE